MGSLSGVRGRRAGRGQAVAEFALAAPVILIVMFAIFDLGRAVYAYNTISDAARTGVRVAIVDQSQATDCVGFPDSPRCAAARQALALGVTADDVTLTFLSFDLSGVCPDPEVPGCVAEVEVGYAWTAVTPLLSNIVGAIDMSSIARLPIERSYDSTNP